MGGIVQAHPLEAYLHSNESGLLFPLIRVLVFLFEEQGDSQTYLFGDDRIDGFARQFTLGSCNQAALAAYFFSVEWRIIARWKADLVEKKIGLQCESGA